jgi:hypothetical protein
MENQRILNRKRFVKGDVMNNTLLDDLVSKELAKTIADTMTNFITRDNEQKSEKSDKSEQTFQHEHSFFEIRGLKLKNLRFTLDIFQGSDLKNTRIKTEKFTMKIWGGYIEYNLMKEQLLASIHKIQTTIGYIDDPVTLKMKNVGGYWDVDLNIPEVYVRTSQYVVDKIIVLFTFNALWSEYDMIYSSAESIRFRHVYVSDIYMRFKYYNNPVDYKKILKGNWKYLVRLIPHCDLSLTFPNTIIKYQVGWEDLVDTYVKELISKQKLYCVKKMIVGTAKRKFKKIMGI